MGKSREAVKIYITTFSKTVETRTIVNMFFANEV